MTREEFLAALDALIAEKHLLKHPFYQLWSQGRLTTREPARVRDLLLPARRGVPDATSRACTRAARTRRCGRSSSRT